MIDLKPFGYRSRAAFLRDRNVPLATFEAIAAHEEWWIQKSVLLHPDCPIEIRERFTKDEKWYKRFVAYFASVAPKDFWKRAASETHYYIARVYKAWENPPPAPEPES